MKKQEKNKLRIEKSKMEKAVQELKAILEKYLKWHNARITLLSRMLLAIIEAQTVNLAKLAKEMYNGQAKIESIYRQLQRFFAEYSMKEEEMARLIGSQLSKGRWIITIDRTEWFYGTQLVNLLVLGVIEGGVAVPLLIRVLDDRGNSNTAERIELLEKFNELFGYNQIKYLAGDREFIGGEWIKYLKDNSIDYRIRIKSDAQITYQGKRQSVKQWFSHLQENRTIYLTNCYVYENYVNLAVKRLKKGKNRDEWLIVIGDSDPATFFKDYRYRWGIEMAFGYLKSRGFNFEDTHLTDPSRIQKMTMILAVAFIWVLKTGCWYHESVKRVRFKKTLGYREKSLFRYGLDLLELAIRRLAFDEESFLFFRQSLRFLSCT